MYDVTIVFKDGNTLIIKKSPDGCTDDVFAQSQILLQDGYGVLYDIPTAFISTIDTVQSYEVKN